MLVGICEARIKTEEICISWLKPEGGNEIDNYIVEWMIESNMKHYDIIPYNGMESNTYTIYNLQPSQVYIISIRAQNNGGEGDVSTKMYATGKSFLIITSDFAYLFRFKFCLTF